MTETEEGMRGAAVQPAQGPTAVLIATAAVLEWGEGTVLGRLVEQLAALGAGPAYVIARPGAEHAVAPLDARLIASEDAAADLRAVATLAREGAGPLVIADGDLVTQPEALAGLLADPRIATGVLGAAHDAAPPSGFSMRVRRGRVLGAASPYHRVAAPNGTFLGVLKVRAEDRRALADVAGELAAWEEQQPHAPEDVASLLLVGLVRRGVHVGTAELRGLFWARPGSAAAVEEARERIVEHDEERARLNSAVKASDGFFTTFFVSPYSRYIARWAARRGLTPNQVTLISAFAGALAALAFATGHRPGLVAGAVLLQVAFTLDCVDGQLARYTRSFSRFGAWLDSIFDRGKEYLVYAGLAIGASRVGDPVWLLAGAALALQTTRHAFDFSYPSFQQLGAPAPQPPIESQWDSPPPAPREAAAAQMRWRAGDHSAAIRWAKKVVVLPIGERFAAISVTAALFSPRTTFVVLLAWGGVAALYAIAGRTLRALA